MSFVSSAFGMFAFVSSAFALFAFVSSAFALFAFVSSSLGLFADVLVDFLNIEAHLAELADHLRQFSSDLRDDAVHVAEIGLGLLLGRGSLVTVLVGSGAGKCFLVRLEESLTFGERDASQTFSHTVDINLQDSQLTTQLRDLLLHLLEGSADMMESSATDSAMESSVMTDVTTMVAASTTGAFFVGAFFCGAACVRHPNVRTSGHFGGPCGPNEDDDTVYGHVGHGNGGTCRKKSDTKDRQRESSVV